MTKYHQRNPRKDSNNNTNCVEYDTEKDTKSPQTTNQNFLFYFSLGHTELYKCIKFVDLSIITFIELNSSHNERIGNQTQDYH